MTKLNLFGGDHMGHALVVGVIMIASLEVIH